MPQTLEDDKAGLSPAFPATRRHRRVSPHRGPVAALIVALLLVPIIWVLMFFLLAGPTQKLKLWSAFHAGQDWNATSHRQDEYLIGVGKADVTGPCVELNLMGYADPNQIGTGLRQRLYSRAFIVADSSNPADRFVYLVLDTQSGDTAVRYGILSGLEKLGAEYDIYGHHNVAVTGTHSHSGPGAWLNYLLPQITSKGFDQQSYRAIVDGAILSIRRAHESLAPGHLSVGSTKVFGANINRSLFSYLANPEEERARYNQSFEDDGSVEKDLTMLKFQRASDGKNIGVLTWFPTHGTSVLGNNTLISGDNKGVAAYLFEKSAIDDETAAEGFVAGFSQASVGDTSPNVLGAWCEDGSGEQCSFENSTCSDGRSQKCHARGPMFTVNDEGTSSCFEIGKRQFEPARKLYDSLNQAPNPVRGHWVKSFHTFHNMSNHQFQLPNGTEVRTCAAALGYSFAAGTSDGPGAFDFTQHGSNSSNTSPLWRLVGGLLKAPTEAQAACHGPKPILLDVGEVYSPYQWTPNVVDVQVLRVGQLAVVVSPGEATTMAGRRWKHAVAAEIEARFAEESGAEMPVVVLGGPANSYTHYITTEEEYGIQRYEGASTLYGPHTLAAYINVTLSWIPYLSSSASSRPPMGPEPPDNSNRSLSFIPHVIRDAPPLFKKFGDVKQDVEEVYQRGARISATFVGANPRNDLRLERTYAAVEKFVAPPPPPPAVPAGDAKPPSGGDADDDRLPQELVRTRTQEEGRWEAVRDDSDFHLVFGWRRTSELLGTSEALVSWETAADPWAEPGRYRLRYFGNAKSLVGEVTEFEGVSGVFELVDP
ncbi:Neutral/alkaline nonlysosomal ceramidase [Hypoxylon sp. FL1284]|nr:Neutral/alkaline nonlysosomal ceramidase [Hypoxylon sp. FL1284]